MKLTIASLIVGSAAAFQPHTALNAVPKSSSALDMKVRFRFPLPFHIQRTKAAKFGC